MRYGPLTTSEAFLASLTGLYPNLDGGFRLPPDDLSPTPNWTEADRDGFPVGWFASTPPLPTGDHYYVSQPGNATFSGATPMEVLPPRDSTRTRQTSSPHPLGALWLADKAIVGGIQPSRVPANLPKPLPPIVSAVTRTTQGFPQLAIGELGWAYGFADENRKRTPISAFAYNESTIGVGQGVKFPLPDLSGTVAPYLIIYVKIKNGPARQQAFIDLSRYVPNPFEVMRYRDDGKEPPEKNETGVGRLPKPAVAESRPGSKSRAWVHEEKGPSGFGIQPGRWRFYLQVKTPLGASLLSIPSNEKIVNEEREGRVWRCYPPRNLPAEWRYTFWVLFVPENGEPVWGRVGPTRFPGGANFWFKKDRVAEESVGIWGYFSDVAPGKLEHRLYSVEPPDPNDPEADGTVIPAPDPTGKPDVPYPYGIPWPKAPASYKVSSSRATVGYPGEGPISESTQQAISDTQTFRARARSESGIEGLVYNAEGADRNSSGDPSEWSFTNFTAPVTRTFSDGTLRVETSTNLSQANYWSVRVGPRFDLPDGLDTDLLVVGTIEQSRSPNVGAGRLVLRQIDDAGATTDTVLTDAKGQQMRVTDAGVKTLLPKGHRFGPNGTAFAAGTVSCEIILQPDPAELAWNQILRVRDVQAWAFGKALRKANVSPPDADDPSAPANPDNVSSANPYPQYSQFFLGPAPTIAGGTIESTTPIQVVTFEGGVWPAGWTAVPNNGNAVHAVETTSAIHGSYSWRFQDDSTNAPAQRGYWYDLSGEVTGAAAMRFLCRVERVITKGELYLGELRDGGGNIICSVRLHNNGQLRLYRHDASGNSKEHLVLFGGITPGTLLDVEIAVAEGNTNNGVLRLSAGKDGPRSATVTFSGVDLTGRNPRQAYLRTRETDSAGKVTLRYDQIVLTEEGDVLDRESPSVPTGYTPPDPDAPPDGAGGFRLFDSQTPESQKINQWWGIVEKGLGFDNRYGPHTTRPVVVKPGVIYTHALYSTHRLFDVGSEAHHQFFVTLSKDEEGLVDPIEVGSPYGPGAGSALVSRGGSVTTAGTGMALEQTWGEFYQTFTVPEGYYYAHIHPYNDAPGVYTFQEHLFAEGSLTTALQRDAKRTYGALDTGTLRVTIDSNLAAIEFTPEAWTVQEWIGFGASHGAPDLTALPFTARSSGDGLNWSTETAVEADVPEARFIQIAATLSEIDGERPEIPPGGVFLETRPAMPVLLDSNRRPFPGMILAGIADVFLDWETNDEPVNKHALSIRVSDQVDTLTGMGLRGFTREAWLALVQATPNTIFYYEDPFGGEDGTGRVYKIRFYSRLEVERVYMNLRVYGGVPRLVSLCETPEAEVLEISNLAPARG